MISFSNLLRLLDWKSYFWSSCLSRLRYFSISRFFDVFSSLRILVRASNYAAYAIFLSNFSVSMRSLSMAILSL